VIHGGTVWTPEGPRSADVLIAGGRIAAVGSLPPDTGPVDRIDAGGRHVLPGFIDVHVHVADRIAGCELVDDVTSAGDAAVRTGITTYFTFATQRPSEGLEEAVRRMELRAAAGCACNVGLHLTPTGWPWDWDAIERLAARGLRTVKLYTTYREAGLYTGWERLEEVMGRLAALGIGLLLHCEDDEVLAATASRDVDPSRPAGHALLRPERAEVEAIRRAVALAARTGCRMHVVHVSTAEGAAAIASARGGARVTGETCPHYLLLTEDRLGEAAGHRYLCTPPLRSAASRARLEAALLAGEIDLLATDHCAFTRADKDRLSADFRRVPGGLPGIGALAPLAFELLVRRHSRDLGALALRLAENPARAVGLYPRKGAIAVGADADLVVVETEGPERPIRSSLSDCHDPWSDRASRLGVGEVIVGGDVVIRGGAPVERDRRVGRLLLAP